MCYRDPADDIPDSCLRLSGLVIEAASSLTKRELALRLMHGTIEKLAIEVRTCKKNSMQTNFYHNVALIRHCLPIASDVSYCIPEH